MKRIPILVAIVMIVATANAQYVTKALDSDGNSTFNWDKASNFVIFSVGETEYETMRSRGIKADFSIDGISRHLYVWENSYTPADAGGLNSFGHQDEHIALSVGTMGWSGFGMVQDGGINLSFLDDTYVLHLAMKAQTGDNSTHGFGVAQARFSIGPDAFAETAPFPLLGDIGHDGEWYYIDIPWSVLKQCAPDGIPFPAEKGGPMSYNDSYFWGRSGGVQGTELHIDNIFFYKDSTISPVDYKKGDVNGDESVDVADINILVNIMLGKDSAENYDGRANVDGQDDIDVADINAIINIMLDK